MPIEGKFVCRLLIVAALLLSVHPALARECGETLSRKNRVSNEVEIQVGIAAPSFYARSGNFVMLLDPAAVESTLMAHIADLHIADDERLLAALKKQLPLSENRDIFQLALEDVRYFVRAEYLLASLLEQGKVALLNLNLVGTGANSPMRRIVVVSGGGGQTAERREFCAPSGELLLGVTDSIS